MSRGLDALPVCARCARPVRRYKEDYPIFDQMHWACFHYEFEHIEGVGDPDEACRDPNCPARAFDPEAPPSWEEKSRAPSDTEQPRDLRIHRTVRMRDPAAPHWPCSPGGL